MRLWIAVLCSCWLFACSDIENPPAGLETIDGLSPQRLLNVDGEQTEQSRQIASCVAIADESQACTLNELHFIGYHGTTPTKQQILDRLLVSHEWMADNFALLLDQMPGDMYRLLGSTTAIIIDADIRPAFFWSATGAIYLDPYYLWMTPEQKATISDKADHRSSYDDALSFKRVAQYSHNGAYPFGSSEGRSTQQALHALSAVMFHELAHATDYFPAAELQSADNTLKPAEFFSQRATARTSQQLYNSYPLQSTILYYLGQVQFKGDTATPEQIALTASDVGNYFATDGANDAYNYATINEDTAMLFEETMMKIHYNIDREVAFVTVLAEPSNVCSNVSFDWSSNNRVLEDHILPRAELVVDQLLPGHDHADFFSNPPTASAFSICQPLLQARGSQAPVQQLHHDHWH